MNIPKPNVPHMIWKITSEDKTKEGMIHVLELEEKTEIKIVLNICNIKGQNTRM